jgi:anaerobic ribonucleoside-triphosphate reductase activating protein
MQESLYAAFVHAPLEALGPGARVGVWLEGCPFSCRGCMEPSMKEQKESSLIPVKKLARLSAKLFWEHKASGVTLSGGEPFFQPEPLKSFLLEIRSLGLTDILAYSGFEAETILRERPWAQELLSALVCGPFEADNPSAASWKGSGNQRLFVFDEKLSRKYAAWRDSSERKLQLVPMEDGFRVIGIPKGPLMW